jgi:hypothetical protein
LEKREAKLEKLMAKLEKLRSKLESRFSWSLNVKEIILSFTK